MKIATGSSCIFRVGSKIHSQPICFKVANHGVDFPYAPHLWVYSPIDTLQYVHLLFCRIDDIQNSLVTKAGKLLLPPNNLLIPFMFREWERRPDSYKRVNSGQNHNLCLWSDRKVKMERMFHVILYFFQHVNLSSGRFAKTNHILFTWTSPICTFCYKQSP